jgi:hypothetical protein
MTLAGNTSVTLLLSSTANDQLTQFDLNFVSLTLTSQSGKTVSLFATTPYPNNFAEFIHLNGASEPFLIVSIPQDVYTSATATIGTSQFSCTNLDPAGNLNNSTFSYRDTPASDVTVNLPAPITVTGTAMGLALNLLVSKSASFANCDGNLAYGFDPYTITPTFNLTPVVFSSQPTNSENGRETGLQGLIASVSGSSFAVASPDGPSWSVDTGGTTAFQGISGASGLSAGMAIDMDVAIQTDGSLLATRVAMLDANPTSLSLTAGPVDFVCYCQPSGNFVPLLQQGYLYSTGFGTGSEAFSFGTASFTISGQAANLQSPPFNRVFNAASMVPGQNLAYTFHATQIEGGPLYVPAATVTLMPQTINGTVQSTSSTGGFSSYTVSLAAYDLFPTLAVQAGQSSLLANPRTVTVYVDPRAQLLNSAPLAVGSVLRFTGLIFNDGGALKMDCSQVSDGVAE